MVNSAPNPAGFGTESRYKFPHL